MAGYLVMPAGAAGYGTDVTTLERLSGAVFQSTAESIWLLDETGRTLWANDRLSTLLGEPPEQIASMNFLDFSADGFAAERFHTHEWRRSLAKQFGLRAEVLFIERAVES